MCPHRKQMEDPGLLAHTHGTFIYCVFHRRETGPGLEIPVLCLCCLNFPRYLARSCVHLGLSHQGITVLTA